MPLNSRVKKKIERAIEGIPARLREVRGERSQRAFAIEMGVFQQNVNRYEQGTHPQFEFLLRLVEMEGVDLHWLLTGDGSSPNGS